MPDYRPDWYPDPSGAHELRWHNGSAWTADVSDGGSRYVDPLPVGPNPSAAGHGDTDAPRNGMAIAGLVLGVGGLLTAWLPYLFAVGAVAASLGVVFGWVGLRRSRPDGRGRGPATAGMITGGLGCVAAVGGFFFTVAISEALDEYENPVVHEASITACESVGSVTTAEGEIVNRSEVTADFTVFVGFVRSGTDNADRSATIVITDVARGETRPFEVQRTTSLDDVDCIIVDVNGPQPFGFPVD